jgi:threonine dehydrogenase-like Zn-dependent dehydrogenase
VSDRAWVRACEEEAVNAVVVDRPGSVALREVHEPVAGPDEVLVRVRGCGICGTDQHILHDGLPTARYPLIPGHEAWGEIVALPEPAGGRAGRPTNESPATTCREPATRWRAGQLVAIDPSLHCGTCRRCRTGQGNLCERWGSIGGTRAGAWSELVAVPARNLYELPEGYPLELAVLIEPVACLLRGLHLLAPQPERSALVFGAGTMGSLWALALRARGLQVTAVVETDPLRARICASSLQLPIVAPGELGDLEADYVIDATGSATAMEQAVWRAAPGGSVMFFGVAGEEARVPLPPFRLYERELRILSSMAILHTYGEAVAFIARHAGELAPIVTDVLPLASFEEALARLRNGASLKVALDPSS